MGDLGDSLDRDTRAMEKLASAMERIATVLENRFAKEYPEKVNKVAEIVPTERKSREQELSDKADPEWFEETEQALAPSRFQIRANQQQDEERASPDTVQKKSPSKRRPS